MLNKTRSLFILTITILILSILPGWTEAAFTLSDDASEAASYKPYLGNVNKDDNINVGDAITILRHIVGLTDLDTDSRQRADVNLDGEITVSDAIMVLRYIVGLIPEFPFADPAVVSTEQALNHVIHKTGAATVILADNINLTEELDINRDITVKAQENGDKKTIQGNVKLLAETAYFTARNLIINGTIVVDTGGKIDLDFYDNCDIYQALFLSGEIMVTGGKNIRSVWISPHALYEFDETPVIEDVIDSVKSALEKTTSKTISAGEENIELIITLKDFTGEPVNDSFDVVVENNQDTWFSDEVNFNEEGRAVLTLTVTKAKEYEEVLVKVKDIIIGSFDVTVEPADIDGENSIIDYDEVVTAGEGITLELQLKDKYKNPVTGEYSTNVEFGERSLIYPSLAYPPGAAAQINFNETRAASHTGTVEVENIFIGEFTLEIKPAEAAKLALTQEPAGSSDGSGKTGEVIVVTQDKWGNDTASGLEEPVYIEVSLPDERITFTGDSVIRKEIDTGGGFGKVKFTNLQIDTNRSLFDVTMVFYTIDGKFEITTTPFNIIGFAVINEDKSGLISYPEKTGAAHDNIKLDLELYDSEGNLLSGTFLTTVGDGWYEEPVQFESGWASISVTQTAAGDYADIAVLVDNAEIGTFDVTVEPAEPEVIELPAAEEMVIADAAKPISIPLTARDIYGNPVSGADIYVYCFYVEGSFSEPEERGFDDGTVSRVSDDSGKVVFDDLIINDTGNYRIVFYFEEARDFEEEPVIWQKYMIIPHPEESMIYWDGYHDPLESEINRPVQLMAAPRDENGELITGLEEDDFTINAHYRENDDSSADPVRGTLTRKDFEEVFSGLYGIEFRYNEETDEPLHIEITVSFRGEPLDKKIPVTFQPEGR